MMVQNDTVNTAVPDRMLLQQQQENKPSEVTSSSTSIRQDAMQQQQQQPDSSSTTTALPAQPSPQKSEVSNEKLDKAVRFWMHPSLGNVSSDEKLQYLRNRIGLTEDEIHGVWDRVLQEPEVASSSQQISAPSAPGQPPLHRNLSQQQQQQQPLNGGNFHQPQQAPLPNPSVPPTYPSWPTTPYPAVPPPDGSATTSPAFVPLWITLGGFLGVVAAAAVRWLNGGDFCLFPPPQLSTINLLQRDCVATEPLEGVRTTSKNSQDQQNHNSRDLPEELEPDYDQDEDDDVAPVPVRLPQPQQHDTWLAQQVQSLTQTMESHVRFQERLLQNLASETTNRSMNLLASKTADTKPDGEGKLLSTMLLWSKLVEIRVELSNLHSTLSTKGEAGHDDETVQRLKSTLEQLETCIGQLNPTEAAIAPTGETLQVELKSNNEVTGEQTQQQQIQTDPDVNEPTDESQPLQHLPSLPEVIRTLAEENDATALRVGAQLLYLYVIHLLSNPHVPRYRKIFTANESFAKVQQLRGGVDLLRAVGFVERDNFWEWQSEHDDHANYKEILLERLREAAAALSILKSPAVIQSESPEQTTSAALAVVNTDMATTTTKATRNGDDNRKSVALSPSTPFTPTSFRSSTNTPLPHTEAQTRGGSRDVESPFAFQTPGTNNIISPPTTKKHPFLSPEEFTSEPSCLPMPKDLSNTNGSAENTTPATSSSMPSPRFPSIVDKIANEAVTPHASSSANTLSPAAVTDSQVAGGDVATTTGKRLVFEPATSLGVPIANQQDDPSS